MITKAEDITFTQQCVCDNKTTHNYISFTIVNETIVLPTCIVCNSVEILLVNNNTDAHGVFVNKIF